MAITIGGGLLILTSYLASRRAHAAPASTEGRGAVIVETVPAALAGERLDRIVALMLDVSRSLAAAVIDAGGAAVDGRACTTGKLRLLEGQEVAVDPAAVPVAEPPRA